MSFMLKPGSIFIDIDGIEIQDSRDGKFRVNGDIVTPSVYSSYLAEFYRDQIAIEDLKLKRIQNEIEFLQRKIAFYEKQIYLNAGL